MEWLKDARWRCWQHGCNNRTMLLRKLGVPSWSTLKTALENIGEKELASEIGEYDTRERTWKGGNQERDRRKENTKINSFHRLNSMN